MPSPEVRAKAEELTKGLNTDLEKTEALYDYVAKNFRYVSLSLGLGRYQPHAAADVLQTSTAIAKTSTRCWHRCWRPKACTPLRS